MNKLIKPLACFIAFSTLSATSAIAIPRTWRIEQGTLQKVDLVKRSAEVVTANSARYITWTDRTKFYWRGGEIDATFLADGAQVRVTRYVPSFGPPFVSKIVLLSSTVRSLKER